MKHNKMRYAYETQLTGVKIYYVLFVIQNRSLSLTCTQFISKHTQNILIACKDFSSFKSRTLNSNSQTFKNVICIQTTDKNSFRKNLTRIFCLS